VGVAPEIGENLRQVRQTASWSKRSIDAMRAGQIGGENADGSSKCARSPRSRGLRVEGLLQAFEEQATEQAGERLDGEKEVRPPGDPARPIGRETAAWHDAMHVWMMR